MYLQLAENNTDTSPYISVPTSQGLVKVREDYFDTLPPAQWNAVMDKLAPFQPSGGLSELSDKETRARRKEARTLKKEARAAKAGAKAERVASGEAAADRAAIFGKVGDTLKGVAGSILPGLIPGLPGGGTGGAEAAPPPADEPKKLPGWVIPVGVGVAGLAVVYFLTRPKKNK